MWKKAVHTLCIVYWGCFKLAKCTFLTKLASQRYPFLTVCLQPNLKDKEKARMRNLRFQNVCSPTMVKLEWLHPSSRNSQAPTSTITLSGIIHHQQSCWAGLAWLFQQDLCLLWKLLNITCIKGTYTVVYIRCQNSSLRVRGSSFFSDYHMTRWHNNWL